MSTSVPFAALQTFVNELLCSNKYLACLDPLLRFQEHTFLETRSPVHCTLTRHVASIPRCHSESDVNTISFRVDCPSRKYQGIIWIRYTNLIDADECRPLLVEGLRDLQNGGVFMTEQVHGAPRKRR